MRFTRRLSRPERYAVSSVVAFAAHWSLAYALPTGALSYAESKPALVWLEAAPLATGAAAGTPAQDGEKTAAQGPSVVRKRVKRDVSRGARASAPQTVSSATERDTPTAEAGLELRGPGRDADDAPAVHGFAPELTAQAPGGASGLASGSSSDEPTLGTSGDGALVHGPILRAATGCSGYFPADAHAGHGEVEIEVTVDAGGHARESHVLNERPFGQGFGVAARGCVRTLSFAPAVDRSGAAVSGHAKLRLRFDRPFTT